MSREIKPWTSEEEEFLKENYKIIGAKKCSEKLKRKSSTVASKARKLGLHNRRPSVQWGEDEILFLKENFAKKGSAFCYEHLSDRTIESIRIKAARIGLTRNKGDRYNQEAREKRLACPVGYSYCSCCDQVLSIDLFYKKKSGGQYGDFIFPFCRTCSKERVRRSHRKNRSSSRETYQKNPEKRILDGVRSRANIKGIEFNLEISDIIIPEKCPVLGIPLIPFSSSSNSPTIDRFYPEKGYVKGNIFIISRKANTMKLNASIEEVEMLLNWMRKAEDEINDKDS